MRFSALLLSVVAVTQATKNEMDDVDMLMLDATHNRKKAHVHDAKKLRKFIDQRDGKNFGTRLGTKYRDHPAKNSKRTQPDSSETE